MNNVDSNATERDQSQRAGNLANKVSLRSQCLRLLLAFGLGALSSVVFAPLELSHASWFMLIPILFLAEKHRRGHFLMGYFWGLGQFLFCLAWLKEVILPAPLGVALIISVFPAIWTVVAANILEKLRWPALRDLEPKAGKPNGYLPPLSLVRQCIAVITLAALWCTVEWCRSWFATGFPWNLIGVSMWNTRSLLPVVAYAGVYGLSFLVASLNVGLYLAITSWLKRTPEDRKPIPYGVGLSIVFIVIAFLVPAVQLPEPSSLLKVTCIQGNIPQIRVPTRDQYEMAQQVYHEQTIWAGTAGEKPDLIVWPETALPFPLFKPAPDRDGPPSQYLWEIMKRTDTPMLIGTLDTTREAYDAAGHDFNSAVLIDSQCRRIESYDKIKTVPFGEFLPFEHLYPGLLKTYLKKHDLFMRSLTPGSDYTTFTFNGAKIGVNICYEDIFPEISRNFVLRGANLLMTITNDAWYNETSGSHQHLVHAVFRAVETGRPLLRSGNNSDTCLILPDGSITEPLVDPSTGNRFYRGRKLYHVPLYESLPITFYTRYGDLFARCLALISLATLGYCVYRYLQRRKVILDRCSE